MQKFKDLPYQRPSLPAMFKVYRKSMKMFKKAKTPADACAAYVAFHEILSEFNTPNTIASIRNSMDLQDAFYAKEMQYYGLAFSVVMGVVAGGVKKVLKSPFRKDLEAEFGIQSLRFFESMIKGSDIKVFREMMKENALVAKYNTLTAACSVEFQGKQCNYYGLNQFMQSPDREIRREAYRAWTKMNEEIAPQLDEIFTEMTLLRVKKAKKMGFDQYIDYAFASKMRYDYTPEDAARFREQVLTYIVPVCQEIQEAQRQRLDLDSLTYYDRTLFYPEGNPIPQKSQEEMLNLADQMYAELSPETDEFFRFMREYELIDIEVRPNKRLGGYCTILLKYKAPFIFGNFSGADMDLVIMTHESGHAFQAYYSAHRQEFAEYIASTSEINEIHSIGMEFLTFPWMELFLGDDAERFRKMYVAQALGSIPYTISVDEFQEELFKNPAMTAQERREVWKKIEKKYLPWCDYDGNELFESGAFWMTHPHIFAAPFYYIEYALSRVCALQYYLRSLEDHKAAWEDYLRLCAAGGSLGYFDLLREGNLKNPFADGVVKEVVDAVKKQIDL